MNFDQILLCYREYMNFIDSAPPTQKEFLLNMVAKMQDEEFIGDTMLLLCAVENYNPQETYQIGKSSLLIEI